MSEETLSKAEQLLLQLLPNGKTLTPANLLELAAEGQRADRLTMEELQIALWSLLASGGITRTSDHSLRRGRPGAAAHA